MYKQAVHTTRMGRRKTYPPPENIRQALAEAIRERQGGRGFTAKQLDEMTGIDAQNLTRWLLPGIREIGTTEAAALASAFGITLAELYADAEAKLAAAVTAREAEAAPQTGDTPPPSVTPLRVERRRKDRTRREMDRMFREGEEMGDDPSTRKDHTGDSGIT